MNSFDPPVPATFEDFVGQRRVKERLEIAIQAAKLRGDAVPHMLLVGPIGLGKATLASIIAKSRGVHLHVTSAKCLATERNTACVFHMMRVLEVGLKSLAKALNVALDWHERSWEKILTKIQDEITKRNKSGDPDWAAKRQFFEESYGLLNAVRVAWRNPTMHVENSYDPERADHIYRMVRDFMEHLSTKLAEEKPSQ